MYDILSAPSFSSTLPNWECLQHIKPHRGNAISFWKFPNGLKVILREDSYSPIINMHLWYRVGSAFETPGKTGMAHLFEHLMFKETKNMADGEFDRLMENMGGSTNAATWTDWTFYINQFPKEGLSQVIAWEADRMENMVLNQEQLDTEREVVINERLYRVDDSVEGKMEEALLNYAFMRHPYRWDTIGWLEDIKAITLHDCLEFYQHFYAPNTCTIVLSGDFNSAQVLKEIECQFGHLTSSQIPEIQPLSDPPKIGRVQVEISDSIANEQLLMGFPICEITNREFHMIEILNHWLFEGRNGKIKRLFEKKEISFSVSASPTPFAMAGLLIIEIDINEGHTAQEAINEIDNFLANQLDEFSEKDLSHTKQNLCLAFFNSFNSLDKWCFELGFNATLGRDLEYLFDYQKVLNSFNTDDVIQTGKKYLRKELSTVVICKSED